MKHFPPSYAEKINKAHVFLRMLDSSLSLRLLDYISKHPGKNQLELCFALRIQQSEIATRLNEMYRAGIINKAKDGKHIEYSINVEKLERTAKTIKDFVTYDDLYHVSPAEVLDRA